MGPFKGETDILQQSYQWWSIGNILVIQVKLGLQSPIHFDITEELEKIGIIAEKNPPNNVRPIIVVRYHGFRIDSDIAESLQGFNREIIKRIILIILHRHEERANYLHGKVQDPEKIPYCETETPDYKDYKMLKGIIHIHLGPEENNIFQNCDAEKQLKTWIKEIKSYPMLNQTWFYRLVHRNFIPRMHWRDVIQNVLFNILFMRHLTTCCSVN